MCRVVGGLMDIELYSLDDPCTAHHRQGQAAAGRQAGRANTTVTGVSAVEVWEDERERGNNVLVNRQTVDRHSHAWTSAAGDIEFTSHEKRITPLRD
ncbi:hypothetical protein E2C01_053502 [Portunus trituberculatus]|uniref:Uncharacterized protein n=1 Tax=Portunus trituberculatus TaxID=210409 RepID=A0A5B7GKI3_PORTR|nr:hypothetical protein [Portunus trituberculatus]